MPMTLTFNDGGRVLTIRNITKLEAEFAGPNTRGEVTAYLVYTGGRPTEHHYHSRVPVVEVVSLKADMERERP